MDFISMNTLIGVSITLLSGSVGWFWKGYREDKQTMAQEITAIRYELHSKVTEAQVRQLIEDKLDPLKEDMKEVKTTVNKLLDIALKQQSKE